MPKAGSGDPTIDVGKKETMPSMWERERLCLRLGPRSHDRCGQEGDYAIDVGKRETVPKAGSEIPRSTWARGRLCHRCRQEGDCT